MTKLGKDLIQAMEEALAHSVATIPFETIREKWHSDPEFRKAYAKVSPEMDAEFAKQKAR